VTDRFGGVTTESVTVEVLGAPPVVQLGDDIALDVGQAFDFSGTFTDPDGEPTYDYVWKFGDGNTSVGRRGKTTRPATATHAFLDSGEFTVTLEVTDRDGNTGSATMIVNVRGINTDPCATGVATVRSRLGVPMAPWNTPFAWENGAVPGPNDWVLIQGGNIIYLPTSISSSSTANRLQVRGICIAQNGTLQSDFNRHNNSPSTLHLFAASIHNQGTIAGAPGVEGSGPANNVSLYNHATNGSSLLIYVNRFENAQTGQILTGSRGGRGGNDIPYLYLSHGQYMDSQGGHGGRVEIFPAIFINNGRVQGGNGGNADNFDDWAHWIDGNVRGGDGGLVRVFATNLAMSSNGSTGQVRGGCGGDADGVGRWQTNTTTITSICTRTGGWSRLAEIVSTAPRWAGILYCRSPSSNTSTTSGTRRIVQGGIGGNVSVNMGSISGSTSVCNGDTTNRTLQNSNTNYRTYIYYDPTTLTVDDTTRFEGSDKIVLFGGEDWVMDLRGLTEGAITADETITLAVGKEGVIDLRGVSGKVFAAGAKLEVFADKILLDQGVTLEDLADAPEVIVKPSKILYNVELSHAENMVEEPGTTVPVNLTILNSGPMVDTYDINLSDSAGWEMGDLPSTVTVNGLRRSELTFDVTLPETRGEENMITVTVTSQGDPEMQAVAEIRVNVKKEERITPRNGEKADITLAIDDTMAMGSELVMVSNAMENLLTKLVDQSSPSEEEMDIFMAQFSEDNPPTNEEMSDFLAKFEKETPMVELLTFKEEVISRVVTQDIGDIISRIRSIQPVGSDDCPNASVATIESALENINPNGQIILVTASAPHKDAAAAIAKAQENGIKINVILTGSCGDETADKALYQRIADETGGTFNWSPKGVTPMEDIEDVMTKVVEDSLEAITQPTANVDHDNSVVIRDNENTLVVVPNGTEEPKTEWLDSSTTSNLAEGGIRVTTGQNLVENNEGGNATVDVKTAEDGSLTFSDPDNPGNVLTALDDDTLVVKDPDSPNVQATFDNAGNMKVVDQDDPNVVVTSNSEGEVKVTDLAFPDFIATLNEDGSMTGVDTVSGVTVKQDQEGQQIITHPDFPGMQATLNDDNTLNVTDAETPGVIAVFNPQQENYQLINAADGTCYDESTSNVRSSFWSATKVFVGKTTSFVSKVSSKVVQLTSFVQKTVTVVHKVSGFIVKRAPTVFYWGNRVLSRACLYCYPLITKVMSRYVSITISSRYLVLANRVTYWSRRGYPISTRVVAAYSVVSLFSRRIVVMSRIRKGGNRSVRDGDREGQDIASRCEIWEDVSEIDKPVGKYSPFGTLVDKEGKPMAGVTIKIGDQTTVTDANGGWEITGLSEDKYTLIASKEGYIFPTQSVELGNDEFKQKIVIKPVSALEVMVAVEPRQPKLGENVTYTSTVTNGGTQTATGVVLTQTLPEGTTLVSLTALNGGNCDENTLTCTLPDITTGNTAKVQLMVGNAEEGKRLQMTATLNSNEYPTDVQVKRTSVTAYLSVEMACSPTTIMPQAELNCTTTVELSEYAPSAATGVKLTITLPQGVQLNSDTLDERCVANTSTAFTCTLVDLSLEAGGVSQTAVNFSETLQDPGLLLLTHEAQVTANEYPVGTDRARTKIYIPPEYQVDMVLVVDVTHSMQEEMNGAKQALIEFVNTVKADLFPLSALIVFRDEVTVTAVTKDMNMLIDAIEDMEASGGGLCPEASAEALEVAIRHVKPEGIIALVTDASPYDDANLVAISDALKEKAIKFNPFITGDCSNQESWNVLPNGQ
jgi:uncharacterized repeat protein (TIGR01451 family)